MVALLGIVQSSSVACSNWKQIHKEEKKISQSSCGMSFMAYSRTYVCSSNTTVFRTRREVVSINKISGLKCDNYVEFENCVNNCESKHYNVSITCQLSSLTMQCAINYETTNSNKTFWGDWKQNTFCSDSSSAATFSRRCFDCSGRRISSLHCPGPSMKTEKCVEMWANWGPWGACLKQNKNRSAPGSTGSRTRYRKCLQINGKEAKDSSLCSRSNSSAREKKYCIITQINPYFYKLPSLRNKKLKKNISISVENVQVSNSTDIVLLFGVSLSVLIVCVLLITTIKLILKKTPNNIISDLQTHIESPKRKTVFGPVNGDVYATVVKSTPRRSFDTQLSPDQ